MKKLLALFIFFFLLAIAVRFIPSSFADGGNTTNLTIHKTVLNPQSNRYVDNMGLHDSMFHPGDPITFHVTIGNTGSATILQVVIKDVFPKYVTFISAPGSFDPISKTLTILTLNLAPNTTQTFSISGRVMDPDLLPNQSTTCDNNQATAGSNNNQTVQDAAQFCILNTQATASKSLSPSAGSGSSTSQQNQNTQQVYPPASTTTTPDTGAGDWAIVTMITFALSGIFLRRNAI